jgi:hypothetical protein
VLGVLIVLVSGEKEGTGAEAAGLHDIHGLGLFIHGQKEDSSVMLNLPGRPQTAKERER